MNTPIPEHEKLKKVADKSQTVGEFIEWLTEQGVILAEWNDHPFEKLQPHRTPINELLAQFFNIDLKKIEAEKKAMLEEQRSLNSGN